MGATSLEAYAGDHFSLGLALAELAEARGPIIGPIAARRLDHERKSVRLVAWACVLAAEPASGSAVSSPRPRSELLPTFKKSVHVSPLGVSASSEMKIAA